MIFGLLSTDTTCFQDFKNWAQLISFFFAPVTAIGVVAAVATWRKNRKRFDYDLINTLNGKFQSVMRGLAIINDAHKKEPTAERTCEIQHYILCYLENCEEELKYITMNIVEKDTALMWLRAMIDYIPCPGNQAITSEPEKLITKYLPPGKREEFMKAEFAGKLNYCQLLSTYICNRKETDVEKIYEQLRRHKRRWGFS